MHETGARVPVARNSGLGALIRKECAEARFFRVAGKSEERRRSSVDGSTLETETFATVHLTLLGPLQRVPDTSRIECAELGQIYVQKHTFTTVEQHKVRVVSTYESVECMP